MRVRARVRACIRACTRARACMRARACVRVRACVRGCMHARARILNDYGFKGFPLRKDFPLTVYIEVYYNDNKKKICYKNLELGQEYRVFSFKTN